MVRAVDSVQGRCVLVPPHLQPSVTGAQSHSTGKHRSQLWMSVFREQLELQGLHLPPLALLQGYPNHTLKKIFI